MDDTIDVCRIAQMMNDMISWLFAQFWEHRLREDDGSGRHIRVLKVKNWRSARVRNRWGQTYTVTFL